MPKNPEDSTTLLFCWDCGKEKPATSFYLTGQYRRTSCNTCMNQNKRRKYHTNPRARAMQIAWSVEALVKRKFPEALTDLSSTDYADALLSATHCHYCDQPNDGTHPFNLDHREALGNGGRHELANLVPCCEPCNRAKRDMPVGTFEAWLDGVAQRRLKRSA